MNKNKTSGGQTSGDQTGRSGAARSVEREPVAVPSAESRPAAGHDSAVRSATGRVDRILSRIPVLGDVLRQPLGALGFFIVLFFLILVAFAPLIAPYNFAAQDIPNKLKGPSPQYLLGTDHLGRDILSRLIYGSRIALCTAIPAVAIAMAMGVVLGLVSGYIGGVVDDVIVIAINALQAFPSVILALAMLALLGPSLMNVVFVIGVTWTPSYARVVRAQVLSARETVYVDAERSLGATNLRILVFHILPNVLTPVILLAAMDLPWVITFESGLSFLGLGVRPPSPSWGVILSDGFDNIRRSPWPITWSGLFLILTTLGFTLFGEALRDVLDPKFSGRKVA